jgi:hypothetical protein
MSPIDMPPPRGALRLVDDAPESGSLGDKVDACIADIRDVRTIARSALAVAGRLEQTQRAHGDAIERLEAAIAAGRSEARAVGASIADLEAAIIIREARDADRARALAGAGARKTAAAASSAVAGVYVAIEVARIWLGG